ncbi:MULTISPECIES: GNAT family N-acetyltransferase [unclassified Streptomyces]|uniref:GNAT family N-acetyltransferase n=1 Tax=Streptomyces sp. R33 TaxID=3238629 RepID=A0AB39XZE0_9ACTN|nr:MULTISPECIES: GNAT family protein [unclassified Streptomyces]KJY46769.1 acetyltransferase [Streptomyces sp. NRRL S-444]KOY57547.1 acetyltransferase [Streptomyces sp. XY332]TDU75119.1 ribosomal-protein-alanine N-acetyltransferase [Streptomyces sp. KS 21]THA39057.1 N-acetyltransferase [Streptomyces sp. A1547]
MSYSAYLREGEHVGLRPFRLADGPEFTAHVHESRHLHRPWLSPPATIEEYEPYATRLIEGGSRAGFLVCERATGAIAGFVNVNNIVRGAFDCGALGYGAFAHAAGRGLFREALGLVVGYAFTPEDEGGLGLHRLEANIQPGNAASLALVRGAGFRLEGFSPDFLFVEGAWRDHERWAITAEMCGPDADRAG